jgi:RND superfamily putative drug exporter
MRVDAIYGAIGRFSVRFRWLVLLVWVLGAIAASTQLPSLSSVTQGNNQKFLPASAPSSHAADLAKPFGTSGQFPIPVVAASASGPLTPADNAALTGLQARLATVPHITRVIDAGQSSDGRAHQYVALASASGSGNQTYATDLVNGLRAKISQAHLPPGLSAHVTGSFAVQVDQQKASGNTGNKVQSLSILFVIVLLVLILRSFTLALVTVLPAVFSDPAAGQFLVLLRPRLAVHHSRRRHAGRRADPAAGAAVDPAHGPGREAHLVQGLVWQAEAHPVEHPGLRQARRVGSGRRTDRA